MKIIVGYTNGYTIDIIDRRVLFARLSTHITTVVTLPTFLVLKKVILVLVLKKGNWFPCEAIMA